MKITIRIEWLLFIVLGIALFNLWTALRRVEGVLVLQEARLEKSESALRIIKGQRGWVRKWSACVGFLKGVSVLVKKWIP